MDDGPPDGVYRTTLITGDLVELTVQGGRYDATVVKWAPRPGSGDEPSYQATAGPDGVFVIPSDAEAAIAAGQLDRSLFDVAYLAAHGYTDAKTQRLPVIVQYKERTGESRAAAERNLKTKANALAGGDVTTVLESIGGAGVSVPKASADDFWTSLRGAPARTAAPTGGTDRLRPEIEKVWLDRPVSVTLDESVPLIGAPQAWADGYDGTGVTVAVLDTGIDATHPDLQGKVAASRHFVGDSVADGHGHGTHVASTVVGAGGTYRGVAPGARLAVGKVLGDNGNGTESGILAGMEWAAVEAGADIVSMSLGGGPTDGTDPLSQAVDELTASTGALFVIAAGNSGPGEETIGTPGAATSALTVAATDKQDRMASFSSRGPRKRDGALKPDIAAPGVSITAARAAGTSMGTPVDDRYTTANGTSMATPHVAGAAAILRQQHADWSPERIKAALTSTSLDTAATAYEEGAGRVAVDRAVRAEVVGTTAGLDFGKVANDTTDPITRELGFSNGGSEAVTLTVTSTLRSSTGETVPEGTLTAPHTVTVPAGETVTAPVVLDIGGLAFGSYTGVVTATDEASGVSLSTPVATIVARPTVMLTIRTLDRDGQPMGSIKPWDPRGGGSTAGWAEVSSNVAAMDVKDVAGYPAAAFDERGSAIERVEVVPGTYSIKRAVNWWDSQRAGVVSASLIDAQVEVREDTTVVLDAREAVPVGWTLPHRTAQEPRTQLTLESQVWDGRLLTTSGSTSYDYLTPTERVTAGAYRVGLFTDQNTNPQATMTLLEGRRRTDVPLVPRQHPTFADRGLTLGQAPDGSVDTAGGWVPFPAGTHRLELADVGFGRPEDLDGVDLRGKLALLRWGELRGGTQEYGVAFTDRIDNVQEAGAAGFILYGDPEQMEPEQRYHTSYDSPVSSYNHWPESGPKQIRIPELQVRRSVAHGLLDELAKGPVAVEVRSDPNVRYNVTGSVYYDQQLPADLNQVLDPKELAKTEARLHSATAPGAAWLRNTTLQPGSWFRATGTNRQPMVALPRDGYVNYYGPVADDVLWSRMLTNAVTRQRVQAEVRTFAQPIRLVEDWNVEDPNTGLYVPGQVVQRTFEAAAHPPPEGAPRVIHDYCAMCRQGNFLVPSRQVVAGNGHYLGGGLVTAMRMFDADGTEIPLTSRGSAPAFELKPEPSRYVATLDQFGVNTRWSFSSAVPTRHTVPDDNCIGRVFGWPEPCAAVPLVYLSYDLGSSQRLDTTLPAGKPGRIGVRVSPGASTEPTPEIAGLAMWTSVDGGKSWNPARVVPRGRYNGGERWYDVVGVRGGAGQKLSLKAEAWDADGNRVQQVITDRLKFA